MGWNKNTQRGREEDPQQAAVIAGFHSAFFSHELKNKDNQTSEESV